MAGVKTLKKHRFRWTTAIVDVLELANADVYAPMLVGLIDIISTVEIALLESSKVHRTPARDEMRSSGV